MNTLTKLFCVYAVVHLLTACNILVPDYKVESVYIKKYNFPFDEANDEESGVKFDSISFDTNESINSDVNIFYDEYLKALLIDSMTKNLELRYSLNKVKEFELIYNIANLGRLPEIGVLGNSTRSKTPAATSLFGKSTIDNSHLLRGGISDYEIDFWGKALNQSNVELYKYISEKKNYEFIRLSRIYDAIETYYKIVSDKEKIKSLKKMEVSSSNTVRLNKERVKEGNLSRYELVQSEIISEKITMNLLTTENHLKSLLNKLKMLVGTTIHLDKIPDEIHTHLLPKKVPLSQPEELLNNRADIVSAENKLVSDNYSIAVARANLMPNLTIKSLYNFSTGDVGELLKRSSSGWEVGASVSIPVFSFGKLTRSVDLQKAVRESSYLKYEYTVENAFTEVNVTIVDLYFKHSILESHKRYFGHESRRFNYAQSLYENGAESYFAVLDASRQVLDAETSLIDSKADYVLSYYNLYKHLGVLDKHLM